MTLDQLYYFRKLAELQHYTKSAAELYISQPSLSHSMKNLEDELGISLFQKNGRNIVLTDYGREFYQCIDEVLTLLDDGIAMLKKNAESTSNNIFIATLPLFSVEFISKNIRTFMKLYPQTKFDIFTCINNKEVINGMNDGIYDLGLCYKVDNEKDLVFVPILRQDLVIICKKDHELSKKEKITLSDLREYPLITYRESNPLGAFIRNLFKSQKVEPNIVFAFDEDITICEMVAQDFGIAVLDNMPILRDCFSIIPLDIETDLPLLYLVYHKNSMNSKVIQNFIRLLKTSSTIA